MLRVTLKALLAHKRRLVATSLSVVIGVAFVAGSLILTSTIRSTLDDLLTQELANTDVVVRGKAGEADSARRSVSNRVVDQTRQVRGVREAVGVLQRQVELGSGVSEGGQFDPPTIAANWIDDPELSTFRIAEGTPPLRTEDVVVDRSTAREDSIKVGDSVEVTAGDEVRVLRVSGIAIFGASDTRAGAGYVLMRVDALQDLLDFRGFDYAAVAGTGDQDPLVLADRVDSSLQGTPARDGFDPQVHEVVLGTAVVEENRQQLSGGFQVLSNFLLVFAGIALFVAAFIVHNTFSILLNQRVQQTALLRALGARRQQLVRAVLVEATAVGLVASTLGLVGGVAAVLLLKVVIAATGINLPASGISLDGSTVLLCILTGVTVTVLPSVMPAVRGSRVSPLAAIREVEVEVRQMAEKRQLIGLGLSVTGVLMLVVGFLLSGRREIAAVSIGLVMLFVGAYVLSPAFARPLTKLISRPLVKLRGTSVRMARDNAMRNPARTAATSSALMIGMTLITFMSIFAESAKTSIEESVDRSFPGDFVVRGPSSSSELVDQANNLSGDALTRIQRLPQVEVATALQRIQVTALSKRSSVSVVDTAPFSQIFDAKLRSGSLSDLDPATIAIDDDIAKENNLSLRDKVEVDFGNNPPRSLEVVAIYDAQSTLGDYAISQQLAQAGSLPAEDAIVMVKTVPESRVGEVKSALESTLQPFPGATVVDITAFKDQLTSLVDQVLNVFLVLLAMAVLVALFGITNTLSLSIAERTKEIGLLRAVGMSRAQLRAVVRWEAVLVAIQGTLVGLFAGLFMAGVLITVLSASGISTFAIPVARLVLLVLLAGCAGVMAGFLPARRAAQLDVLKAIAPSR